MKEFLNIILSFPTVGFTIFLGFVVVYWLFVLLGALDLDLFDLDADIDADVDLDLDLIKAVCLPVLKEAVKTGSDIKVYDV